MHLTQVITETRSTVTELQDTVASYCLFAREINLKACVKNNPDTRFGI